jgi:hypothetical protein
MRLGLIVSQGFNAAMSLTARVQLVGLQRGDALDYPGLDECVALPPKLLRCFGFCR